MSNLISKLRARLQEKSAALDTLAEKAAADNASNEDIKAYDDALAELERINEQIEREEKATAIRAKLSKPADAPAAADPARPVTEPVLKTFDLDQQLSLAAAAIVVGKSRGEHPLKVLADDGYGKLADTLKTKAVNTLVSAEGGLLVPTAPQAGIMELLRKESTFLAAGPVRVPLTAGRYTQPRGLAGATAAYVAEGALKPVSTPTFDSISMIAKKLAGIVPMTNEARMWTVGDIEAYVRTDLRNALALTLDLNAWLGTGAGASPTGILNKAGVQTVTAATYITGTITAPTLAELDLLANAFILKMTAANLYTNQNWRWVMPYRTALRLSSMRVGDNDGDLAFPELSPLGNGGQWKGFPVIISSQIPTTGGGTTDETTLALVDFTHVLYGEEEGIVMKMSDQATLDVDGAGTLVHLWQQNMFAILAESMHDFGLRTALAVVKSTIRF
jgi:HK97 family phage major capsid protein